MSEEQPKIEEQPLKEEKQEPSIPELLKRNKAAPSQEQIDAWKKEYGDVFASGFSPEELFIFRSLGRPEYIDLQVTAQEQRWNQFQMEEATCDTCVLWPSDLDWSKEKAGTPGSLSEMIMQNSNFVSPAAASMLVVKL